MRTPSPRGRPWCASARPSSAPARLATRDGAVTAGPRPVNAAPGAAARGARAAALTLAPGLQQRAHRPTPMEVSDMEKPAHFTMVRSLHLADLFTLGNMFFGTGAVLHAVA